VRLPAGPERLQKIIAAGGVTSRRKAEELITQGRVTVNGEVVRELGAKADPQQDDIKVDGRLVRQPRSFTYALLNKPKGVICTLADPEGRTKVTDLVRVRGRVYPVGRLDFNTEGLIILTNDGAFARLLSGAGMKFPKVYEVKVKAVPEEASLERLRRGMRLRRGIQLAPCRIVRLREGANPWLEVTLTEGRNRQIREMFEAIGTRVLKLRRTQIGFLSDQGLPVGRYRHLTPDEVERAFRLAGHHCERASVHRAGSEGRGKSLRISAGARTDGQKQADRISAPDVPVQPDSRRPSARPENLRQKTRIRGRRGSSVSSAD
jgi:23S rRNA pseudouridine2605 synthase